MTLIIRLGAMGDILHTLPAVASLKMSWPTKRLVWITASKWLPLLNGNPAIDELIPYERRTWKGLWETWKRLRLSGAETAIDFQGLIQSALVGRAARPRVLYGFAGPDVREQPAAWLYNVRVPVTGPHRVQRNLQLAAGAGATAITEQAWVPQGCDEGVLPAGKFVLTTPFAGWAGKEWPLAFLDALGERLEREGIELVANVPVARARELQEYAHLRVHTSSLAGLIGATRRAHAVVAPDSGPLHLAAALGKPGVALFGPTDPEANGPFGRSLKVLRASGFETTYKRDGQVHPSMRAIGVQQVADALFASLAERARAAR